MRQNIKILLLYFLSISTTFSITQKEVRNYSRSLINKLEKSIEPRYIKMIDSIENRIIQGILFTYKISSYKEKFVELCIEAPTFRCFPMKKNKKKIYYTILPVSQQKKYIYKFRIDGIYTHDKANSKKLDDGYGSFFSVYFLKSLPSKKPTVEIFKKPKHEKNPLYTVTFRIKAKDAKNISLLGNFNHWSLESDFLTKTKEDIFEITKRLKKGEYYYYFYVDGEKVLDLYNPEVRYNKDTEEVLSYLKIEEK